jgi:AraC-like DNA-binding protein
MRQLRSRAGYATCTIARRQLQSWAMSASVRVSDFEFVLAAKRRFLESARTPASAAWRTHLRQFVETLQGLLSIDRGAALACVVMAVHDLQQLASDGDAGASAAARIEEAFASPDRTSADVLACVETALTSLVTQPPRRTSQQIVRVLDVIEARYAEPLTIEHVAHHVSRARGHVASAFRRETGTTIHQYLTRVRMRHAAELLKLGEKVEAVMLMVGYRSKKSFYARFRAYTGQTPGAYRVVSS